MRYFGDFRSLDTSVDPNGQKYRVLIFTDYDGTSTGRNNTGPYPWKYTTTYESQVNDGNQMMELVPVRHWYPTNGTELTLARHPFEVKYVGDTNKLYKPYRCSTATVSFIQSTLNTDFINSLGQNVLVMLLKWKNDVYESSSNTMKNAVTGEQITKVRYRYYDDLLEQYVTQRYDYDPWAWDKFCYTVEWIGFSTPTMINVDYEHVFDKFSLQCQDALSTLKYVPFERTAQMEQIIETLFRGLAKISTYKDIYISTAIHLPAATDDFDTQTPTTGTAMKWLAHQQDNFIDEDGEPFKYMDVIEDIMEYLCLTAIPYKDKLFIVNETSLGNGFTEYNHYQFQGQNDILPWILPVNITSVIPTEMDNIDITDTVTLNKDSFCGDTQLSSNVMYNKVKVVCDELRPDPLLPNLSDDDNYKPEVPTQNQPLALNLWDRYATSTPGQYDEENYHYLEMYLNGLADGVDDIKFYCYPGCGSSWSTTPHDPDVNDFVVTHARRFAGQSAENPAPDWVYGIIVPPPADYQSAGTPGAMSCMIDYADTTVSSRTQIPTSFNLKRGILLATPCNQSFTRYAPSTWSSPHDWDDKNVNWNPMLYLKSKPFLGNGKQYLNINGTFTYFGMGTINPMNWYPGKMANRTSSYFSFSTNRNYIWTKVKMGDYYLANVTSTGRGQYEWVDYETYVRLWFDDAGMSSGADYRWTSFNMETNIRGINGISVELPVLEGYAEPMQIEIWFDRPLGPGENSSWCPHSTVITGLEVNIYSDEYVESRKRRNPDRDNTEYHNDVLANAIEEYPEISLVHSSCDTAGLSFSETVRHTIRRRTLGEHVWKTNPKIINDGDGYFGLPEVVTVHSLTHHLQTPTLTIQTALFNKLTPISRILWPQFANRQFVVDEMSIDYEYEQCDVSLIEIKSPSTVIEYSTNIFRVNSTRNYHRTQDIMFNGHVARRFETPISIEPAVFSGIIEVTADQVELATDDESLGTASLNVDWSRGQYRLTTSSEGGMTATSDSHGLITITV